MNKRIYACVVILSLILILSGCGNKKSEQELLKDKLNTEISYIDSELVSIANALNNINYSKYKLIEEEVENVTNVSSNSSKSNEGTKGQDENKITQEEQESSEENTNNQSNGNHEENQEEKNDIFTMTSTNLLEESVQTDWSEFYSKVESLYTVFTVVSLDLKEIGILENDINDFNNSLDALSLAVKSNNSINIMNSVVELYSYLPDFMKKYEGNNKDQKIINSKYYLLVCYRDVNEENWTNFENSFQDLKMSFSNVNNSREEYIGKEVNINNANAIIRGMQDTINLKDKSIFFIKYKNLIQEFNILYSI